MEDSGFVSIFLEMLQPAIAFLLGLCLLGIKIVLNQFKVMHQQNITLEAKIDGMTQRLEKKIGETDSKIDAVRLEVEEKIDILRTWFQEETREFQRKEVCASHREYLNKRIDALYMEHVAARDGRHMPCDRHAALERREPE